MPPFVPKVTFPVVVIVTSPIEVGSAAVAPIARLPEKVTLPALALIVRFD